MKTHDLVQGSAEWLSYRAACFNASDAPAMLGHSPYKTRTQLLQERHTGIVPEVDAATQRRFDDGHRFEALARPLAEEVIGQALYPVTGSEGSLSASFDGLTMAEDIGFEHKSLNEELRRIMVDGCMGDDLPMMYQIQMQQQCMVAGCKRILFMASKWDGDDLIEERHCWYEHNQELANEIMAGWFQFQRDLANYTPKQITEPPKAEPVLQMPALVIQIKGEVTRSNLPTFVQAADTFLADIKTTLETDQDFANAESNIKACDSAEKAIDLTKRAITAQAASIDEVIRTMDLYQGKLRTVRLKLQGLVKTEKEERKRIIVMDAKAAYCEHLESLQAEIDPIRITLEQPDFAEATRNKRSLTSIHDAVDTLLAQAKISADSEAKKIRAKMAWFTANALSYNYLFHDLQQLICKPEEDFRLTVTTRIEAHKAAKVAEESATRERIANEERIKAEAVAARQIAQMEAAEHKRIEDETAAICKAQVESARVIAKAAEPVQVAPVARTSPASAIPTLKLGAIAERLGFQLTAAFIASIGFEPAMHMKSSVLYHEDQFKDICAALVDHINSVCALQAA